MTHQTDTAPELTQGLRLQEALGYLRGIRPGDEQGQALAEAGLDELAELCAQRDALLAVAQQCCDFYGAGGLKVRPQCTCRVTLPRELCPACKVKVILTYRDLCEARS